MALQARLRAPGGCPWDREQTHESLRTYLVEETYEVLDALDSRDADEIAGELGDLLLQIVFHAGLGREAGRFDIGDVIERIHTKMVRRHPHVFGDAKAHTAGEVLKKWEQQKAEERVAQSGAKEPARSASILDGVSSGLPGLVEAHQLSRRAANAGFDWVSAEGVLEKIQEEVEEIGETLPDADPARREEEIGDLLFTAVNLARFLGLDPEIALKRANRKFKSRFQAMEREAATSGRALGDRSPAELDALWNAAKGRRDDVRAGKAGK
ncbi:MAG: nucleoside triphosphate pyrophosphohydrolase [Candidatus Acidiferrales bacterium]